MSKKNPLSGAMGAFKRMGKATQDKLFDVAASALAGRPRRTSPHDPTPNFQGQPQTRASYPTAEVVTAAWGTDSSGQPRSQRATAQAAAVDLGMSESQIRAMMRSGSRPRDSKTWNKMTRLGRERGDLQPWQTRPKATPPMSDKELLNQAFSGSNKAAASELGVSPGAVSGWKRRSRIPDPAIRQRLADKLIGQGVPEAAVNRTYDVDGLLLSAYGGDGRGLHATAAAKELGISTAQLRGMRERGRPPRITADPSTRMGKSSRRQAAALDKLLAKAKTAKDANSVQRKNIADAARGRVNNELRRKREAFTPNRPEAKPPVVRLNIEGNQGVQSSHSDNLREQVLSHPIDDEKFEEGMSAFEKGDEEYAKWLQAVSQDAVTDWTIEGVSDIWFDYDK